MAWIIGSSSTGLGVKLFWDDSNVNDLVDAGFDLWKVERQEITGWAAISPQPAWPPIVQDMNAYVYHHSVIDPVLLAYRATPVKSSDMSEGTPIDITADLAGYCSLQDVRDQGYTQAAYPDDVVYQAINNASRLIDKVCRQWFEPRFRFVSLDGRDHDKLWFEVPIITIMQVEIDEALQSVDNFVVYNRHLTHGIVNPDDRANPQLAWGDARENVDIRRLFQGGRFNKARKSIRVAGIFGYTDIGNGYVGETVRHNQIPLSYGETPAPLVRACLLLTLREMVPVDEADEQNKKARVTEEKTRDQMYKLGDASESDNSWGITGILEVDKILQMYPPPMSLGVV